MLALSVYTEAKVKTREKVWPVVGTLHLKKKAALWKVDGFPPPWPRLLRPARSRLARLLPPSSAGTFRSFLVTNRVVCRRVKEYQEASWAFFPYACRWGGLGCSRALAGRTAGSAEAQVSGPRSQSRVVRPRASAGPVLQKRSESASTCYNSRWDVPLVYWPMPTPAHSHAHSQLSSFVLQTGEFLLMVLWWQSVPTV